MQWRLLLFFIFLALSNWATAQRNCGSMDYLEQQIRQNPSRELQLQQLERLTDQFDPVLQKSLSGGVLTIPVIVHVVYGNNTENISDAQVNSQIQVLNDDFRRLNADRANTPSDFRGVAADTEIEFCLTQVIRKATTRSSFGTNDAVKSSGSGGSDAVTPTKAMNMWVCEIGGGILGYAQFPGGSPATDGVVVDYRYFGTTGTATAPFDLGRTATHEVGHWLNLRHIWGDGGCSVDDFVTDTPTAGGPNYTGGACTYPGPNSCTPRGKNGGTDLPDMFQNYMDYSDDQCMNLFTIGQKDRMWAAVSAARPELISATCDGTSPPSPQEICDNGIDDDGDGLTDCADPDCSYASNCAPPAGDCVAPNGLTGQIGKGGRQLTMSWNTADGALSYFVEVLQNGATFASGTVSGTSASVTISKNASYTWRVRSNCANGATSDFAQTSVRTARLASASAQALGVYPNPTNLSEVTVTWNLESTAPALANPVIRESQEDFVNVEVRDFTGRVLQQKKVEDNGQTTLDVTNLRAGVYLLHVRTQDGYGVNTKFVRL
ncbi:putative secreted protein (Por secretion system target) [Neolewinella xylanilytica]|uniref:Putative secreted protein (Por secretion system target) n=1 Tax=Neolewinella xylanilytica TaxID=1514080 RepID=A0A2S6I2I2_9BACT|nr:M43 family zinc metalloprotease [Neolewinella xylanilytica]PPK85291.1 putative secreted protein (Por secretion system target) [Neolewinella xylanilytica]